MDARSKESGFLTIAGAVMAGILSNVLATWIQQYLLLGRIYLATIVILFPLVLLLQYRSERYSSILYGVIIGILESLIANVFLAWWLSTLTIFSGVMVSGLLIISLILPKGPFRLSDDSSCISLSGMSRAILTGIAGAFFFEFLYLLICVLFSFPPVPFYALPYDTATTMSIGEQAFLFLLVIPFFMLMIEIFLGMVVAWIARERRIFAAFISGLVLLFFHLIPFILNHSEFSSSVLCCISLVFALLFLLCPVFGACLQSKPGRKQTF